MTLLRTAFVACLAVLAAGSVLSGCSSGDTKASDVTTDAQQMKNAASGVQPGAANAPIHTASGTPVSAPKSAASLKPHGRSK